MCVCVCPSDRLCVCVWYLHGKHIHGARACRRTAGKSIRRRPCPHGPISRANSKGVASTRQRIVLVTPNAERYHTTERYQSRRRRCSDITASSSVSVFLHATALAHAVYPRPGRVRRTRTPRAYERKKNRRVTDRARARRKHHRTTTDNRVARAGREPCDTPPWRTVTRWRAGTTRRPRRTTRRPRGRPSRTAAGPAACRA